MAEIIATINYNEWLYCLLMHNIHMRNMVSVSWISAKRRAEQIPYNPPTLRHLHLSFGRYNKPMVCAAPGGYMKQ